MFSVHTICDNHYNFTVSIGKTSNGKELGVLNTHDLSSTHKGAMISWLSYVKSKETGSIMEQLSVSYSKTVELNRYYIKTIAEIVLFCATHDLPLRGHAEGDDSISKGVCWTLFN